MSLRKGIHTVNWAFLTTVTSARKQTTGIAGNLLNTLYIIVITLLIATPIGVGSAIYLNEYAKPGKLVSLIEFTTEIPVRYSIYHFRSVRYDLLRRDFGIRLFAAHRFFYPDPDGAAADHQKYAGSSANRTGQLSYRCSGNGIHKMAYDPYHPSAVLHAQGIVTGIILALGRV